MARVLFVCLHNAGRSPMSEALFAQAAEGRHEAESAGTTPAARVHPQVVEVMRETGIDLSARTPQRLDREQAERADVVVTMGCGDEAPTSPASGTSSGTSPIRRTFPSRRCAPCATRSP